MLTSSIHLKHPFTYLITGPTGSGKTMFIKRLIETSQQNTHPPPQTITYCYGQYQRLFDEMKESGVRFVEGLSPEAIQGITGRVPEWLIIDDLMHESANSKLVSELFVKGSHHRNLSVILVTQNLFVKGNEMRTISGNAKYFEIFKNPRDASSIQYIARQIYPNQWRFMVEAYRDATREPYSSLHVDMGQDTDDKFRLLSNILGDKGAYITVYGAKENTSCKKL